jgi:hypothetical protein
LPGILPTQRIDKADDVSPASNPQVATTLRATAFSQLALVVCVSTPLGAASQPPPPKDLPVSLDRIREEVPKTPPIRLELDMPVEPPVATFRTRVEQPVFVLSLEEWLEKELKLTELQRQSADWAAQCCGGYGFANGVYVVRLDPLFKKLGKALERRRVRKIREQIARELAELEAARKKAGLTDQQR